MSRTARAVFALLTLGTLTAGCQDTGDGPADPASAPTGVATTTGAPTPTGDPTASPSPTGPSAANTVAVCREVDRLIIEGSRRIAADSAAATRRELTPEQLNGQLKGSLAKLADDVRAQAGKAEDPRIRTLVGDAAKQIDAGAGAASPATWMSRSFVGIPEKLARDCHV
ncbi:hypothetical protein [Micromonospora coxensis]|uniref:Lipoprotein n=1 Tax=Micromonospora coxensis TaxID=356852 RepID=A0A1C5J1F6_9ACTN|nr:hypothetical protein [Micromonospora coxensis]SCG64448.1 hypothetical protein GA0070614_3806 [Micromonospora coxensis]